LARQPAAKIFRDDQGLPEPEIERASVRKIFKSGEALLFSLLVCVVQQLPKIFSLGEQQAFEIRFFRHGKKYRTRTPFFVITTDFSDGNSLMILLSLALTSRRLSIFIIRTPFHR
jgi:hypothetical protein